MIYSVIHRPDNDTHYLYDRDGRHIVPDMKELNPPLGFSLWDSYETPAAIAWAELLQSVEIDPEVEYFRHAVMEPNQMREIIWRVTSYWIDRGKTESPPFPQLVAWSRKNMTDPDRHEDAVSQLLVGEEAINALGKVFATYCALVTKREFLNYGHYWSNFDRTKLLELRILHGKLFKNIATVMGRTNAACRAEYGRIRRGEDNITVEMQDWELFREAMPLGPYLKRKVVTKNA